jgi:hypothetical protein
MSWSEVELSVIDTEKTRKATELGIGSFILYDFMG